MNNNLSFIYESTVLVILIDVKKNSERLNPANKDSWLLKLCDAFVFLYCFQITIYVSIKQLYYLSNKIQFEHYQHKILLLSTKCAYYCARNRRQATFYSWKIVVWMVNWQIIYIGCIRRYYDGEKDNGKIK